MTITLQVGKRYFMRNGKITKPLTTDNHKDFPFDDDASGLSWTPDGAIWGDGMEEDEDIISEYHESPAVDPLTGMPAVYDVPMIETGPRFKIGDRFVTSFCARPEYIGRVLTVQSIGDISKDLYYSDDKYHLSFKRSTCRPATPAEIAAADRPVERVKRKVWLNIYAESDTGFAHQTRAIADSFACTKRVACICLEIDIPEDTGLQGQEFVVRVAKP